MVGFTFYCFRKFMIGQRHGSAGKCGSAGFFVRMIDQFSIYSFKLNVRKTRRSKTSVEHILITKVKKHRTNFSGYTFVDNLKDLGPAAMISLSPNGGHCPSAGFY